MPQKKKPVFGTTAYQRRKNPHRLRRWQVKNLKDADYYARTMGMRLNIFLTVNWMQAGWGNNDPLLAFSRLRDHLGKWLRRHNVEPLWVYVHENPNGNFHTHMLIHMPIEFQDPLKAFVERYFDIENPGAVDVRKRYESPFGGDVLTYMCKGTDWITAKWAGEFAKNQGTVEGKRSGTSENIGPTARSLGLCVKARGKPIQPSSRGPKNDAVRRKKVHNFVLEALERHKPTADKSKQQIQQVQNRPFFISSQSAVSTPRTTLNSPPNKSTLKHTPLPLGAPQRLQEARPASFEAEGEERAAVQFVLPGSRASVSHERLAEKIDYPSPGSELQSFTNIGVYWKIIYDGYPRCQFRQK